MNNTQTNDWISVGQFKELLQISSRTTVYRFARKYRIRASKPLGKTYFNKTDILNVINSQSTLMG
jgi:hypothetical protein